MNKTKQVPIVTIDGPAGSGKGTIAQAVAEKLGWHILDSGALYRLVALAAMRKGLDLEVNDNSDGSQLSSIARNLDVLFTPCEDGTLEVCLEGDDVSKAIRTEECACAASKVAADEAVRRALLQRQRDFQEAPGLVADGRDMGTVVFPDAGVKIYLTASPEIRALRRQNQLKQQGIDANLRGLIRDIEARDKRDSSRKVAPLVPADDAIIIDTGTLSIDEVVSKVLKRIAEVYQ
jgi:cytidylate kinase